MSLQTTTWQTVGPFFQIGLERFFLTDIAGEGARGERFLVVGQLLDGLGVPIPDAAIEIWQANSAGKYAHPEDTQDKPLESGFMGFGRIPTDEQGYFRFTTVKPGSVLGPNATEQAPHLIVGVLMRGLLRGLVTRAYFPDDPHNVSDPILALVPPERRKTMLLVRDPQRSDLLTWEIRMQGEQETVFLEF